MKKNNVLWDFFASVKLALFTLIALAITSIIGTIIPQREPMAFYVERFGPAMATVFQYLNVPDMYNASWFISLLVLFSINLTVCSIERIPNVIRILKTNNLDADVGKLEKTRSSLLLDSRSVSSKAVDAIKTVLVGTGWKFTSVDRDGGTLFFAEKGGWTRFGVYTVHCSILIIFIGAIIGSVFGYKASVMIMEGSSTTQVYQSNEEHTAIPLGFEVRCNDFELQYYDNGMPKEYMSSLTVLQDGKEVFSKDIEVNAPLDYAGLTFYQSSYQAIDNQYSVQIENQATGAAQKFIIVPKREMKWTQEGLTFGIVQRSGPNFMGKFRHKIWFGDAVGAPVEFWADEGQPVVVQRQNASYRFLIKQRFATGLQVAKDPGVWWVYTGCILMIVGLIVVFFLSHRRVWVWIRPEGEGSRIVLAGNVNKNKLGFEKDIETIADAIKTAPDLGLDKGE